MLNILLPDQIMHPRATSLVPEEVKNPRDYILSATAPEVEALGIIINESGQWMEDIVEYEDQKNDIFDQYACVAHTAWNKVQTLCKRLFNICFDKSKRYTAVKSGTIPGRGNSVTNVVESVRLDGAPDEADYPTTVQGMTQAEYYQKIPDSVVAKENFLKFWSYKHAWVEGNSPEMIMAALRVSPVMVSVYGRYSYDENGYIEQDRSGLVTHEVLVVGYELNKFWYVLDSENPGGLVRFAWDYIFVAPKIGFLVNLTNVQTMQIYRIKGNAALYFLNSQTKEVVSFMDGVIAGGSLFKIFFGDYKFANIQVINPEKGEKLPYPIAKYSLTTVTNP